MDYDHTEIAASYDKARALTPEALSVWRRLLALHIDRAVIARAVDLGCGTGRFSKFLADEFNCQVIGVDPSKKMLGEARRRPSSRNVVFMQGSGEAMPLPDGSIDLVFMSMVYHHFADPAAVARECRRVLRSGGYVCIRNSTREADFPHRHFFPAMEALIASDLPSRLRVKAVFEETAFDVAVSEVVTQTVAPNWRAFVEKSTLRADSFLARLSDDEFQRGLIAMQNHRAAQEDGAVAEEIDWFVFRKK
jgi:ubiquinone/menaquinone biosynthesis C-methylase UbiE